MNKQQKNLLIFGFVILLVVALASSLTNLTVISVSKLNIDPQGYEDSASHEWRGSFWSIVMVTDFTDQVAGFHLAANDGEPSETYAESLEGKTYAQTYTVNGKQLVPTADVMVHITPQQPYYERPLEIQQGYYVKEAWGRSLSGSYSRTSDHVNAVPFIHYSFGSGNWMLHTPFKVDLYKDGVLIATQNIDTIGGTSVYRLPANPVIPEFINIIDLGKLSTGYGEPQWDDVLYFSENHIFVRDSRADSLLKYDAGQIPTPYQAPNLPPSDIIGTVDANCFSTFWYGNYRWLSDHTPTVVELSNLPLGFYKDGSIAKPIKPDVFSHVIPYLQNQGIQHVSMPTGFDRLEKVSNKLRVYMDYGSYSSLITIKISTELADTIVWQPQVANFEITDFQDFGQVVDIKSHSITVKCVEGTGSAQVTFVKNPSDLPLSFTPTAGTPILATGEYYTIPIILSNLGTPTNREFSVTANVKNSLGSVTDTATAYGTLMKKTGASTIVHVITQYEGTPISNLPVMIEYAGTSQTKTTGLDGLGTATFNLGTSADVTVKASFASNGVYLSASKTVSVAGGTEKTITLALTRENVPQPKMDWTWIFVGLSLSVTAVMIYYVWRKNR